MREQRARGLNIYLLYFCETKRMMILKRNKVTENLAGYFLLIVSSVIVPVCHSTSDVFKSYSTWIFLIFFHILFILFFISESLYERAAGSGNTSKLQLWY